ncbi:MAG: hypothetical protein QOF84_3379 [Streptomyces sp.]|nr:hypothetical protein [Streptomyces sp.]
MSTPPEQPQSSQPPSAPQSQSPSQSPPQPSLPAQPSAYPYPNPQSPGGYGPPPSVPPQQNPYAQPQLQLQPGGYAPPPPSVRSGGAGRAVLWILLGAVIASAFWAGGVFLLGGDNTPKADLRGYQATSNLCSSVDYSSFKNEYPQDDSSPIHSALKTDALDESYCSISLKKSSSSYSDAYFSVQVDLHHATDPGPEFTAQWENYGDRYDGYTVEKVTGIGDEAYIVTEDTTSGTTSGSRAATLAVRDGWMTYQMSWSVYLSSYDSDTDPPQVDEATQWLKTDTKATLEKLKAV